MGIQGRQAVVVVAALVLVIGLVTARWVAIERSADERCLQRQTEAFRGEVRGSVAFPSMRLRCEVVDRAAPESIVLAPALEIPDGVTPCRADELEVAPGASLQLIRIFNRSGDACGLAGFPTVFGRDADGAWQVVPTTRRTEAAVDGGETWTGVLQPTTVATINLQQSHDPHCDAPTTPAYYDALRLELPSGAGALDVVDQEFEAGPCPFVLSPFAGDSGDA